MLDTIAAMNWLDVIILVIIALSTVISFIRGFAREAVSLVSWIVAIWLALVYYKPLAAALPSFISHDELRSIIAFAILFVGILIIGALIGYMVAHFVEKTKLTMMNRLLGVVFGIARGVLLVALAILLGKLTPAPQYDAWKDSVLIPGFKPVTTWIQGFLPDYINKHFEDASKAAQNTANSTADTADKTADTTKKAVEG